MSKVFHWLLENQGLTAWIGIIITVIFGLGKGFNHQNTTLFQLNSVLTFTKFEKFKKTKAIIPPVRAILSMVQVNMFNTGKLPISVIEVGVIVKGNFYRQPLNILNNPIIIQPNSTFNIDFGHDIVRLGHTISLNSSVLNPFISKKKVCFKVYVKELGGTVYKSQRFQAER